MHLCLVPQLPAFTTLAPEDFNLPLLLITGTFYLSGGYASNDIYISTWKDKHEKRRSKRCDFQTKMQQV